MTLVDELIVLERLRVDHVAWKWRQERNGNGEMQLVGLYKSGMVASERFPDWGGEQGILMAVELNFKSILNEGFVWSSLSDFQGILSW